MEELRINVKRGHQRAWKQGGGVHWQPPCKHPSQLVQATKINVAGAWRACGNMGQGEGRRVGYAKLIYGFLFIVRGLSFLLRVIEYTVGFYIRE